MKKRANAVTALLLVLLLVSAAAPAVLAAEPQEGYTAAEALPQSGTAGKFYLTKDLELTDAAAYGAGTDLTIDLMGHNITQKTAGKRIFTLSNGAKLTIEDSTAAGKGTDYKAGTLFCSADQSAEAGQIVSIVKTAGEGENDATVFTLKSGILDGSANKANPVGLWGGAIAVDNVKGQVVIDGGHIRNFTVAYGAAVGSKCFDSITVNGGEFYGNYACNEKKTADGGGVISVSDKEGASTVTVNGGKYYDNYGYSAAVILINQVCTALTVNGGEFYNNEVSNGGGVIRIVRANTPQAKICGEFHHNRSAGFGVIYSLSPVEITGGHYYENYCAAGGCAFYVNSDLTIADCTVINNYTRLDGNGQIGVIFQEKGHKITLRGTVIVKDNYNVDREYNLLIGCMIDASGLKEGSYVKYQLWEMSGDVFGQVGSGAVAKLLIPDKAGAETVWSGGQLKRVTAASPMPYYTFTSGTGVPYTQAGGSGLSFTVDGPENAFRSFCIDALPLKAEDLTVSWPSITVNSSYLDTLTVGTHTFACVFDGARFAPVKVSVEAATNYRVTSGAGSVYDQQSGRNLTFVSDGDSKNFSGIRIDGLDVPAKYFTASGNTTVVLKGDYLDTLNTGLHDLAFIFKPGTCEPVKFMINAYLDYSVLTGFGRTYQQGSGEDYLFETDGVAANFKGVQIDGQDVAAENYTADGELNVTLKAAFLDTLAAGEHTVAFVFDPGTCDPVTFTVAAVPAYRITGGEQYELKSGQVLSFSTDAPAGSIQGVRIDGKELAAADYIAKESSVTLSSVFLEELGKGSHSIELLFALGTCEPLSFTVDAPKANLGLIIGIAAAIAVLGAGTGILLSKKREK